ncbi:SDR family oxidoreductase [Saccharospirillum impatiens]|uniref:SDR family oxidoreductase n=1 Tax=Saccharospirillum impatiens TaxID=169438 RepID=UPI0004166CF9|nr:SDR family oxidoreductase [Saccharospirillum impatiens]
MSATDRIALVTGGGRGIGAATARLLAREGYFVCINYRSDAASARSVALGIGEAGGRCQVIQADVSQEAEVVRLFAAIDRLSGRLSVLVNNAGILHTQMRLEDMSAERINSVLATNVTGPFLCCREAVKRMSTRHGGAGGAIVNVSSAAARTGSPNEYIDYAASKGALDSMTRGLALEVAAEDIRVNGVRPGLIHTGIHADGGEPGRVERLRDRIPMQRGGKPEEIAEAILWLVSERSSYCTGSMIDLAGGL